VKVFISKVKDPGFRKKLVINLRVKANSFELKTPTEDYKISSIEHNQDPKKFTKFLKVNEVS
jgi:hypothetical protein